MELEIVKGFWFHVHERTLQVDILRRADFSKRSGEEIKECFLSRQKVQIDALLFREVLKCIYANQLHYVIF